MKPKKEENEIDLLVRIAKMYYEDNLRQKNIEEELNLSQTKVSRYLRTAKEMGIVKTLVIPPKNIDLEKALKSKYPHLKEVDIVNCLDNYKLKEELGKKAALYLDRNMEDKKTIALSCGSTIGSMINYITPNKFSGLEVVSLLITGVAQMVGWTPVTLIAKFISKYENAKGYGYQLPPFDDEVVKGKQIKEYYENNRHIQEALQKAENAKYIFLGIGLTHSKGKQLFEFHQFIKDHNFEEAIKGSSAVGEICYQPFDKNGNVLIDNDELKELKNRFLYVPIRKLVNKASSKKNHVVAIAGGNSKREAIQTSLKMKCYNVLICDIGIAEWLCKKDKEENLSRNPL